MDNIAVIVINSLISLLVLVVSNAVYNELILTPLVKASNVPDAVAKYERNMIKYRRLSTIKVWTCLALSIITMIILIKR